METEVNRQNMLIYNYLTTRYFAVSSVFSWGFTYIFSDLGTQYLFAGISIKHHVPLLSKNILIGRRESALMFKRFYFLHIRQKCHVII